MMEMRKSVGKSKLSTNVMQLPTGMYVVRLGCEALQEGQGVSFSMAPNLDKGTADFFNSTGGQQNVLVDPEQSIIIRVEGGSATILVASITQEGLLKPVVRVDRITSLLEKHTNKSAEVEQVSLLGHVEWKGDIKAGADGWLGNRQALARIEGFSITWENRPKDVDIAYSCRVKGMGQTPVSLSGGFVGTRGRAAPIVGVSMSLVGLNAEAYELQAKALFADGVDEQHITSGAECQGPTGNDQLVALQVQIVRRIARFAEDDGKNDSKWLFHLTD